MIQCFPKWYTMWRHWKQDRRSNDGLGKVKKCGSHAFLKFQNKMVTVLKKMMLGYKVVPNFLVGGLLLLTTSVWKMASGYKVVSFFSPRMPLSSINIFPLFHPPFSNFICLLIFFIGKRCSNILKFCDIDLQKAWNIITFNWVFLDISNSLNYPQTFDYSKYDYIHLHTTSILWL